MQLFGTCCTVCTVSAPTRVRYEDLPILQMCADAPIDKGGLPKTGVTEADQQGGGCALRPDGMCSQTPLMPYKRKSSRRPPAMTGTQSGSSAAPDGGTGGDPGIPRHPTRRNSLVVLANHITPRQTFGSAQSGDSSSSQGFSQAKRRDSQGNFHARAQTVVIFDWDDTLFPTTYVQEDLGLDWRLPLEEQLSPLEAEDARAKILACERYAGEALVKAKELAHVAVITLAGSGWVDLSCRHFYPSLGRLLRNLQIPVVYAQEQVKGLPQQYKKKNFQADDDLERYWGLVKGMAIAGEAERFYSQYEGQSWKNILSIGDSTFERYGLLAASSAYMRDVSLAANPSACAGQAPVWSPSQEGCWEKVQDGHVKKLRAKCCKLVDMPDTEELAVELEMVGKWLEGMVRLDEGFDLDLEAVEAESQVPTIEAVFRGERPVSDLPRLEQANAETR